MESSRRSEIGAEEIAALQVTFPDIEILQGGDAFTACIQSQLNKPLNIMFDDSDQVLSVNYLPPVWISCDVRSELYPYRIPPIVKISASWLPMSQRQKLEASLLRYWNDIRDQVLYAYLDILREEAANAFGLVSPLQVKAALRDLFLKSDAVAAFRNFAETTFYCGICLEESKGTDCLRFPKCNHIYCKSCIKEYFESCIRQGNVMLVRCPHTTCTKAAVTASTKYEEQEGYRFLPILAVPPSELRTIISDDLLQRFLHLAEKHFIESDASTVYCPRPKCQTALYGTDPDKLLLRCPKCEYPWCRLCSMTWHYPSPCSLQGLDQEIVQKYKVADETTKNALELRYGKKIIQKLMEKQKDEELFQTWVADNASTCPSCHTATEKSYGCNHIHCTCGTHFCYLCGTHLSDSDPYHHFSTIGAPCYGKLFEGVDPDDYDQMDLIRFAR